MMKISFGNVTRTKLISELMKYKSYSGIYMIYLEYNPDKKYIGSAICLGTRFRNHLRGFETKTHFNSKLLNAVLKHGVNSIRITVLEYCDPEKVLEREQYYLDTLLYAQDYIATQKKDPRFEKYGYNHRPIVTSNLGFTHSEKAKKKLSEFWKGKKRPNQITY